MKNISFSDSGYIIKPPQPSSAIYRAPHLTWHRKIVPAQSLTYEPQ